MNLTRSPLYWWLTITLVLLTVTNCDAYIAKGELPPELHGCYSSYSHLSLRDVVGQSICWSCEQPVIRRFQTNARRPFGPPNTPSALAYVNRLLGKLSDRLLDDFDLQPIWKCRRREYRTLSDIERNRFHRAINLLKDDTTVLPNKYDAIARLHFGEVIMRAHGGPTFLGWHRLYLLLMEMALQEVDPNICLPYWDSSLDNELDDPSSSYVFSADFLGGGTNNATVMDGPFAGWSTLYFGPLIRNIGANGQLYSAKSIANILKQTRTRDVSPPIGHPNNGIEFHHNGVHIFIGGQMNNLATSAHDPAFFLHHAFVDYIWELFRTKQRSVGVDPQFDYPRNFGRLTHAPDNIIGIYSLNITAKQAYSDKVMESYEYEPSPSCSRFQPHCGTKYLQCNVEIERCIPVDPNNPNLSKSGTKCKTSRRRVPRAIQNNFCVDGVCDMNMWVYVPVKVVSMRSPDLEKYHSFPVFNGNISTREDIYQPAAYVETKPFIETRPPMRYEKCDHGSGMGQIFIQSNGLNYDGYYKESVIIDQRLATSIAIGYIAVKDPVNGTVSALFRAFDSCGRICNTAFKELGTRNYESFSGVLHISDIPGLPKQYSKTYGQATLSTWGFSKNQDCPSFNDDGIPLTFYCDYSDRIPWSSKSNRREHNSGHPFTHVRPINAHGPFSTRPLGNHVDQAVRRGTSRDRFTRQQGNFGQALHNPRYSSQSQVGSRRSGISPYNQHLGRPVLGARPQFSPVQPIPSSLRIQGHQQQNPVCKIDTHCIIGVHCDVARSLCGRVKYWCLGSCNRYVVCGYGGHFVTKSCPNGWVFDSRSGSCNSSRRCSGHSPTSVQRGQFAEASAAVYFQ